MKKETADKLAYEMAKARFVNSDYRLNIANAKEVADFIRVLSAEFQTHLSDLEVFDQGD